MPTDLFRSLDIRNRRAFSLTGRDGKEYRTRLITAVQEVEQSLLNVLPSNYISTIGSTNYGIALRSYAVEFAKIKVALEDIQADGYISSEAYASQRADIVYQNLGSLLAIDRDLNLTIFSSQEFHQFLLSLVEIFFGGSTPANLKKGIETFVNEEGVATILENFMDARGDHSVFDISDQFGFRVDFELTENISKNFTDIGIKLDFLIRLIKPAHTLYTLRFLFTDLVDFIRNADDSFYRPGGNQHNYEDARKYWAGVDGRDRMGANRVRTALQEDHTGTAGTAIWTVYGPLSKNQEIPELAEVADVVVTVNAAPVTVSSVSASEGLITLAAPVVAGDTVLVTYYWWKNAEFQLLLNDPGQGLSDPNFVASRFLAFWVLNDVEPQDPARIVWTYGAFERGYAAVLNDPTSLLLNEDPHKLKDPDTGRPYGQHHVLNWAHYTESTDSEHSLNEGTPLVELKQAADPIFEFVEAHDVPESQGWGEMPWGSNDGGWGGPSESFANDVPYDRWVVTTQGGPYIGPVATSVTETGTRGLLAIACEEELAATLDHFDDSFAFPSFTAEGLFLFNLSSFNTLDVLGPAVTASLTYYEATDTGATDTSEVPGAAMDELVALALSAEDSYSDIFDFSGMFIFNQSNPNDLGAVLHDAQLQKHWFDEGKITAQLGAGPVLTLAPYEKQFA